MKKLSIWLNHKLGIYTTQKQMQQELRIIKAQFDHLTSFSNKAVRRKWKRMLTNSRSPFYLFKQAQKDL
jgi:hypothetical protein